MATVKPTVVALSGAFHVSSCLGRWAADLQDAGYPAETHGVRSAGDPTVTLSDDVAYLESVIDPLIEQGKDVLLVLHSYAGQVGTMAIVGRSKVSRERGGRTGGIVGVAYLAAALPKEGESSHAMIGFEWLPWMDVRSEEGLIYVKNPVDVFYHDCDPVAAASIIATFRGQSIKAFLEPMTLKGWSDPGYQGRLCYIRCLQDQALPVDIQTALVQSSSPDWIVRDLDSSHSPFVSKPRELVAIIDDLVEICYKTEA